MYIHVHTTMIVKKYLVVKGCMYDLSKWLGK